MKRKRVVLVQANTAYGRHVTRGIIRYAATQGGWEFLYKGNAADSKVLFKAVAAAEWWADGIVGHFIDKQFLSHVQKLDVPAVNVSSWFTDAKPVRVHTDEHAVGRAAAEYFIEAGVRSFAYWGYQFGAYSQQRCEGFVSTIAVAGHKCEVIDSTIIEGMTRGQWMDTEEQLGRRISRMQKPVGMLCVNDMVAREVLWLAERLGLRCPDDIAVLGVENDELACSVCLPPLSSVELAATQIGYEAAAMLDRLMAGEAPPVQPMLIAPIGVVTRQSTDIAAIANADVRDAVRFIRKHAHEPIDVSDILRAIPISRRALEMRFKRFLRRTPRQQIQYERVQIMKKLLFETDLSIAQVAARAGFSSPSLAWVIFRRLTGLGPKAYRQRLL